MKCMCKSYMAHECVHCSLCDICYRIFDDMYMKNFCKYLNEWMYVLCMTRRIWYSEEENDREKMGNGKKYMKKQLKSNENWI